MKHALWCLFALGIATIGAAAPPTYRESDFARVKKVDTHMHLRGALPVFMKRATTDGYAVCSDFRCQGQREPGLAAANAAQAG